MECPRPLHQFPLEWFTLVAAHKMLTFMRNHPCTKTEPKVKRHSILIWTSAGRCLCNWWCENLSLKCAWTRSPLLAFCGTLPSGIHCLMDCCDFEELTDRSVNSPSNSVRNNQKIKKASNEFSNSESKLVCWQHIQNPNGFTDTFS